VEEVDEVVVLKPDQCRGCYAPLWGDDPVPFRHQTLGVSWQLTEGAFDR
jgi:hypothetical protein